jgi:acetyl-CoA synthetase
MNTLKPVATHSRIVPYDNSYEAVYDLYDPEKGWEELVQVGDKQSMNIAEEAIGRNGDSDRTALRLRDFDTGDSEEYSFGELNAASNQVANYLTDLTDRGDRVVAMLPATLELYAVVFGTLKAGRVYVPLAPMFGPDATGFRLQDAGAKVFVTTPEHYERVGDSIPENVERVVLVGGEGDGDRLESYDVVEAGDDDFEAVETHPDDPLAFSYTSGTTGQPKGVPLEHGSVIDLHAFIKYVVDLRRDDNYFVAASPAWSYGLIMGTIAPGLMDTAIGCYRGEFDAGMLFDTLAEFEVTNAMVPPTALRQLANAGIDAPSFDLRVLLAAGESLDEDSVAWCEETFGTEPQDSYGMTESGMTVCNYAFGDWEVKAGSMGRPLPGLDVALLDDDGEEVEQGEVGEICVRRRENGGGSYWGRPEATLEMFTGPWLRTDDLARKDEDGYFWYVGRKDSVIISSGYRIGPDEVEETVIKHDAVAEVAVVGAPDETRGQIVKAYVTVTDEYEPSDEVAEAIRTFTREELSKHEYPREIEFLDEFPMTATGKIARSELEED